MDAPTRPEVQLRKIRDYAAEEGQFYFFNITSDLKLYLRTRWLKLPRIVP